MCVLGLLKRLKMPRMIYGTAWKKDKTSSLVVESLKTGFRGIDTAGQRAHYNQAGVGAGIAEWLRSTSASREDLFLQTKFSPGQHEEEDMPYNPRDSLFDQVQESASVSLSELKTNYIDSYLLHAPLPTIEEIMEVWASFESLVQQNKVKYLGISNFYQPHIVQLIYERATVKPKVIQNRFYSEMGYDKEIREFCSKNDIVYQSFWTLTANDHVLYQYDSDSRNNAIRDLYRFVMQEGIVPLNGTTSSEHMKEDIKLLDAPPLDKESYNRMKQLLYG